MKRYISIILILLCFFVLNNLFAYTEKDAKNIGFELVLNKSGVNKIYYAKSASIDEDDNIVSTLLSNNRHIFPFLSSSTDTTLSDYLYFVWELDDASGATITLRFVSSPRYGIVGLSSCTVSFSVLPIRYVGSINPTRQGSKREKE